MSPVAVIHSPHSSKTSTDKEAERRKRIEEEAKKEEENVNPNDVHPVLWTIYNVATVAQPILFLFYLGIMAFVISSLVVNPGTFAFNDVLTSALIEGKSLILNNVIILLSNLHQLKLHGMQKGRKHFQVLNRRRIFGHGCLLLLRLL